MPTATAAAPSTATEPATARRGGGALMPSELGQAQAEEAEHRGGDGLVQQRQSTTAGMENTAPASPAVALAVVPSSISKHKVVQHSKIKRRNVDLKTLWSRATKKPNVQIQEQIDISSVEVQQQVPSDQIQQQVQSSCPSVQDASVQIQQQPENGIGTSASAAKESEIESDIEDADYDIDLLPRDPGKRRPIAEYDVNEQNRIRRRYIALGPCQPKDHVFPQRSVGGMRRFVAGWFSAHNWLEYSVELDSAFCFVCYLFKDNCHAGGDTFVNGGFRSWNRTGCFGKHVGSNSSAHNQAQEKYNFFIAPKTAIKEVFTSTTNQDKLRYVARLTYSLQCLRFLLRQGLAFRGSDESETSLNRGNFLELLNWCADNFEQVEKVVLKNAPKNNQMKSPGIQKDLINSCAKETTKLIMEDLGDACFSILADESSDVYLQEQLALCIRYVDRRGRVVERLLGIIHVEDTTSLTLKTAIESLLIEHGLTFSRVRGQGYDGASNMKGHVNGLKKLIMDECPSAYYVHCFAHQLQLSLVAVAKENCDCVLFFQQLANLLNLLGMSCKKIRMLRLAQAEQLIKALELEEVETGKGMNQEMGLSRPGDTRWGSHYKTIAHVLRMYPSIRLVLNKIAKDKSQSNEAMLAQTMLSSFESFDFVFMAHLLQTIFGFTDFLSNALQLRDQDIVNAVELIELTKIELDLLRKDGWKAFLEEVTAFCVKHRVKVPEMEGPYKPVGRPSRFYKNLTNIHRFRVEMFLCLLDRQLRELGDRFDEVNTELLHCMGSFSPTNSFAAYDMAKLMKLAQFYPMDFSEEELIQLPYQLTLWIADMRRDERFKNLKNIVQLSILLVETNKNMTYNLVYKLLKLVLTLPVATAMVERIFSSMTFVKNKVRNKMGNQMLNDCLVTFTEKEFFLQVKDDAVISRFQAMDDRMVVL